jgi:hypothetical protein
MKQFDFKDLPQLSVYRYENFLNIYDDTGGNRFYNLLRSINILPADNSSAEEEYYVNLNDTWLLISYKYYGTIYLWWLVCEYNRIQDASEMPEVGTKLKLLKKELVAPVISNLIKQINN